MLDCAGKVVAFLQYYCAARRGRRSSLTIQALAFSTRGCGHSKETTYTEHRSFAAVAILENKMPSSAYIGILIDIAYEHTSYRISDLQNIVSSKFQWQRQAIGVFSLLKIDGNCSGIPQSAVCIGQERPQPLNRYPDPHRSLASFLGYCHCVFL